jgi:heme-degrading monooxygenase HmoA
LPRSLFLVAWEFQVRRGAEPRFEEIYGSAGLWAKLFASDPAYLRTELQRDLRHPGRYLTLDYWISESAYDQFHASHAAAYEAMDRQCEELTEREALVGRFVMIP